MGKLKIRVKTRANQNKIQIMDDGTFKIWIKAPARKNKANKELVDFLREVTGYPVVISAGKTTRDKLIEFTPSEDIFKSELEKHI